MPNGIETVAARRHVHRKCRKLCGRIYLEGAVFSSLLLMFLQPGKAICEYGSLPGMMVKKPNTAPFSLMWELHDKDCQLKDELTRIMGPPPWTFVGSQDPHQPYHFWAKDVRTPMVSHTGPQVQSVWEQPPGWTKAGEIIKVLYFGDSVDAHQIMDLCKQAESRAVQAILGGFGRNCPACKLGSGIHFVQEFVPGSWPIGPYLDHYGNGDAPQFNIPKGFKNLHQVTGSPTPDIVIYNSLLWDLGRLQVHNHMQHSQLFLTQQYVNEYKLYLDQWLSVVEGLVRPDTLLVFHNAAYPRLKDCRTTVENAHSPLGQQMHITQLNAASKFVVGNRTRWHFLDYGQMSEATMLDFAHLRDGLHPNSQFLAQAFNIVMNLYREHRLELGQNATG